MTLRSSNHQRRQGQKGDTNFDRADGWAGLVTFIVVLYLVCVTARAYASHSRAYLPLISWARKSGIGRVPGGAYLVDDALRPEHFFGLRKVIVYISLIPDPLYVPFDAAV